MTRPYFPLLFLLWTQASTAQTQSVDWKLYGSASVGEDREFCFYEAMGVTKTVEGYVRAWAKCLPQTAIDAIDIEKDFGGQIARRTAGKVLRDYVPPIETIESADAKQIMTVIYYEETANIANIQPRARMFYELNCPQRMIRELSIFIQMGGKIGSRETPREWQHVPPEGSAASLLKLVCPH